MVELTCKPIIKAYIHFCPGIILNSLPACAKVFALSTFVTVYHDLPEAPSIFFPS